MTFRMRITETVKTEVGERFIEVDGEVNSLADRAELIEAVAAAVESVKSAKAPAKGKKASKETPDHNPNLGSSSGLSPVGQFKAGYKAPEQAPLDFDTIKPVPETTLENGFTYSAPAASPAPVQKSSEFSPSAPPPMFSPENMKALAERQAMNSGVKAAPIVSAVEMFDANAPVFIPAPMRTVEPKFTVPAATEEVKKDTESFKNQAWHEAHARANDGMSFKRLLAQSAMDAAQKGKALER